MSQDTGDIPGLSQVMGALNPRILSIPGYWGCSTIVPGMGALESLNTKYPRILRISQDCPRYRSPALGALESLNTKYPGILRISGDFPRYGSPDSLNTKGCPRIVPGKGALESPNTKYPRILGISRDYPR